MKIHNIYLNSKLSITNINLAIGNFDGIHLGHQKIIKEMVKISKKNNLEPSILSFSPHPRQFFTNNYDNFCIITEDEKISILEKLGISNYFLIKFNKTIAKLSPIEFIENLLIKKLMIKNLIVGYDFKFGRNREGDIKLLKKQSIIHNFNLKVIEPIISNHSSKVYSSTLIRNYLKKGMIEKVNECLGRKWSIRGTVVHGDRIARKKNFPTANIIPSNQIHPKYGVYAVSTKINNIVAKGIANFGYRPTVKGNKLLLEVNLFNFNKDIYGKDLTVQFLTFIRKEKKFKNFNLLANQIYQDIQTAKKYHLNIKHGI